MPPKRIKDSTSGARDVLFVEARRILKRLGTCSFDVPHNAQFDWMQSYCFRWTGGRLRMIAARTIKGEVRIVPVGEGRLIVWDYEHLGQTEYLQFVLQVDNDDDLSTLAYFALYNFAARVLLAGGHIIHSRQLVRGARRAFPNIGEIEDRYRRQKVYNNEPITIAGYLLFFHEMAHYLFSKPSANRDRDFQRASDRIANLRKRAELSLKEDDFRSIRGPLSRSEADGVYPQNLINFLDSPDMPPNFVEEVACDLFAIEQLLKVSRIDSSPDAVARLYSAVMMHYQIQATMEGLRQRYEKIESPEDNINFGPNTGNQIRNDIRGFYFNDNIYEIMNPEPSFWPAYYNVPRKLDR